MDSASNVAFSLGELRFEWDANKSRINHQKHRVPFRIAAKVFLDPDRVEALDDREDYGEDRFWVVGQVESRLIHVVYTERGDTVRIISARKADSHEQAEYHRRRTI